MGIKKIAGLVLLLLGIILICWTLYSSYNVFTGRSEAAEVFSVPVEEASVLPEEMTEEQILEEQMRMALPIDAGALPRMLNLLAWGVLAFILIFGGGQIAGIGIKLMR